MVRRASRPGAGFPSNARVFRAARIDSGLALYASLIDREAGRSRRQLHAPPRARTGHGQAFRDLCGRGSTFQCHGSRRQCVAHLMRTEQPQPGASAALRADEGEARPSGIVDVQILAAHLGLGAFPERDDARRRPRCHRHDQRVVGIEHDHIASRLGQLPLGLGDGLPAAELPEVGAADVEHDPDRRRRDRAQPGDVPATARTHLEHQETGRGIGP